MRTGRDCIIVTAGVLLVILLLFGCPQWLHRDAWYVAFAHHFFHVNVFHLAVNCFSLWTLRNRTSLHQALAAYLLATASWFFSPVDVAGASNFIFALIGLRTPSFRSVWWRQTSVLVFLITTILMAALPQVSALTHIISFAFGCAGAAVSRVFSRIADDVRRASYHR